MAEGGSAIRLRIGAQKRGARERRLEGGRPSARALAAFDPLDFVTVKQSPALAAASLGMSPSHITLNC